MKTRRPHLGIRLLFMAGLTMGFLALQPVALPNATVIDAATKARRVAVAQAVADAPYRIGRWVGKDIEVPPAATKLLQPNAILSRKFVRMDNEVALGFLLVHCTDARDMRGHYPPICYPHSGWATLGEEKGHLAEVVVEGQRLPVRVYEYCRVEDEISELRIRVFNAFVLPDGTVTTEVDQINRMAERLALTGGGVAQLQIVSDYTVGDELAAESAGEILAGMPRLLAELGLFRGNADVDQR